MYKLALLIEVVQASITENIYGFISDAFKHPFDFTAFFITFFTRLIITIKAIWRISI